MKLHPNLESNSWDHPESNDILLCPIIEPQKLDEIPGSGSYQKEYASIHKFIFLGEKKKIYANINTAVSRLTKH